MKIYPIDVAFLVTAGGNLTLLGVYGNLDFLPDFISSDVFMVVLISAINYLYGVVALQSWTKPQWVVVAGIVGTGFGILLGPVLIMCQVPELIATLSAICVLLDCLCRMRTLDPVSGTVIVPLSHAAARFS